MLSDVVLDANVLGHSQNPEVAEFHDSRALVAALRDGAVVLVVDEGFSLVESENRSILGHEYRAQIRAGSDAFYLLMECFAGLRGKWVSSRVNDADRRKVNREVAANTRDRLYVRIAINSDSRTLVSHDFSDFSAVCRQRLKSQVLVDVITAGDATPLVA